MSTDWEIEYSDADVRHVIPVDDSTTHILEECCDCLPYDDEGIIVHHAFDKRDTERKPH